MLIQELRVEGGWFIKIKKVRVLRVLACICCVLFVYEVVYLGVLDVYVYQGRERREIEPRRHRGAEFCILELERWNAPFLEQEETEE
jgi:hypothetical protein